MESFAWAPKVLPLISAHHRTGEPLPSAMLERLIAARRFNAGMQMLRQLEFALFDLRLHSEYAPGRDALVAGILQEVRAQVSVVPVPSSIASRTASPTSSAAVTRPATTATSGPKCSPPMPSPRSRRQACWIARPASVSCAACSKSAAPVRCSTLSWNFAAASRSWTRCCASAAWPPSGSHERTAGTMAHEAGRRACVSPPGTSTRCACGCRMCCAGCRTAMSTCSAAGDQAARRGFPVDALREAGFEPLYTGQAAYNGVALLVRERVPVSDVRQGACRSSITASAAYSWRRWATCASPTSTCPTARPWARTNTATSWTGWMPCTAI